MSQKSILSFFKKTPVKEASTSPEIKPKPKSEPVVSTPSRKKISPQPSDDDNSDLEEQLMNKSLAGKKKRRRIISSSEEEDKTEAGEEKGSAAAKAKKSPTISASNGKKLRASHSPPALKTEPATPPSRPTKSPRKSPSTSPPNTKASVAKTKSKPSSTSATSSDDDSAPAKTKKKSPSAAATKKKSSAAALKKSSSKEENIKVEDAPEQPAIKSEPAATKGIHNFFTRPPPADGHKPDPKQTAAAATAYNPAKTNYDPIADAFWSRGEKTPYLALTKTFSIIEATSGRLKMIEYLANFLRSVMALSPQDLTACLYLCLNQLAPAYEGLELGVAETNLMKVIAQTTGRTLAQVRQDAKETGDLGLVAEQSKSTQRMMFVPAALTVPGVFAKLKDIAGKTGASSTTTKADKIQSIFVACRQSEARYFIRSLLGKLRIGLAEQSVLQALGQAAALQLPDGDEKPRRKKLTGDALKAHIDAAALVVKTTHCQCPNYSLICDALLEHGLSRLLELCPMRPGTPLKPMLAHPTRGIAEVLQRFDGIRFTAEFKYDGERAQIHVGERGDVSIYSRNQECNTTKYPDVIGRIEGAFVGGKEAMKSCILDCEAVAWDAERQQILPFQVLSTRKRKDAVAEEIKVRVIVFMFDLLYWDGEPLVTRPFAERRALLQQRFREVEGEWRFATSVDTADMDELQQFLEVSMRGNCEGLMVKTLDGKDATYEIAKRSRNWLKIKKDYLSGVGDSLDLVVIGGYHGKGKRTGTYGGFLLACYDADAEQYQTICKIGTGFSDEDLAQHTEFLRQHVIGGAKAYYAYDGAAHEPDVWFEAVQVWEVLCADLSLSPVHQAAKGIVDPEKGISLRFPRFIRIRDDKSAEDATTAQQVADMYSNQDQIKNQEKSGGKDCEEDFY